MRRLWVIAFLVVGVLEILACEFEFNPSSFTGYLGDTVVVTVKVVKTHRRCTMPGTDGYYFAYENVQVIGATPWAQVSPNTYERKLLLSLSKVGEGYLKIWKNCSKEGYEERSMPITVKASPTILKAVENLEIPFETGLKIPKDELRLGKISFESSGKIVKIEKIELEEKRLKLPYALELPTNEELYVLYSERFEYPILIAGKDILYRFDVYLKK